MRLNELSITVECLSLCSLSLARTSYSAILDRTCPPPTRLICPLIEIELRNKDKRKDCDVLNLSTPEFYYLSHILTFPGQVKQRMLLYWEDQAFLQLTFELRKIEKNAKHHRISLVKTHRKICILTSKGQFENNTSG